MKRKGIIGIALLLVLTLGVGIGVSAAAGKQWTNLSKGVIKYNSNIIIDGNAIGYWVKDEAGIGSFNDTNKIYTITDGKIKTNSIVDIYYAEEGKDAVSKAKVQYTQTDGKVTCTFTKAMDRTQVRVVAMHVVNPDTFTSPAVNP